MFDRPYHRLVVTRPGEGVQCACGARAGYRLSRGGETRYRCPACASHYDNAEWQSEALPHIANAAEEAIYISYREQRTRFPHVTPERWAAGFRETFKPRIEQLEARYQAELELQRAADEGRAAADRALGGVR